MKKAIIALAMLALAGCDLPFYPGIDGPLTVVDGDTFKDANGTSYRLARIDAPEMPGHCRPGRQCVRGDPYVAKRALAGILATGQISCEEEGVDIYGRWLVECWTHRGQNISDLLLATGVVEGYTSR